MNLINFLILTIFSLNVFALTLDEERKYDELEGLTFIRTLSADKKYDEVVKQLPDISRKKGEKGELYFLLADAHYNLKNFEAAHKALTIGLKSEKRPDQFFALWGRTYAKLNNYEQCSLSFVKLPQDKVLSSDWPVYFNCLMKANRAADAVKLAINGTSLDHDYFLMSQRTLMAYGLLTLASEKRIEFLSSCHPVDFYVRLWSEVEKLKVHDLSVLEKGHACHPTAVEITSHMVKVFFQEGQFHSIAYLFEQLSHEDQLYLKHTAEFYKVAGRNTVADYYFSLGDEKDYLMSRSSYFLNKENYAALLTIPLIPSMIAGNKDLSYAIAYSHFKFLSLDASRTALGAGKKTTRDQQLESLIEQCRGLDWRCRP